MLFSFHSACNRFFQFPRIRVKIPFAGNRTCETLCVKVQLFPFMFYNKKNTSNRTVLIRWNKWKLWMEFHSQNYVTFAHLFALAETMHFCHVDWKQVCSQCCIAFCNSNVSPSTYEHNCHGASFYCFCRYTTYILFNQLGRIVVRPLWFFWAIEWKRPPHVGTVYKKWRSI